MPTYTKSQVKILKAATDAFLALKKANPDLIYDSSGGNLMTLRFDNGTVLKNIRPDCSGMMYAIMTYMGYTVVGSTTVDWYGHYTNDFIKDKNGGYSTDWSVSHYNVGDPLEPGDILVIQNHTDMFVFVDSSNRRRGYNAGSGNSGSSIGVWGMQYSVNLANYYKEHHSWTGGGSDVGGSTITDAKVEQNPRTIRIRYVGAGSAPASTGGTYTNPGNKDIFDIAYPQANYYDIFTTSNCGGLIVQVCRLRSYGVGISIDSDNINNRMFKQVVNMYKGVIPLGFYFYSYLDYTTSEASTKDAMRKCFEFMEDAGVTPDDAQLGIWLDLESDGPTPVDKVTNFKQIKWFREIGTELGYPTVGVYSNASYLESNFNASDLTEFPIWVAAWTTDSSWINTWIANTGFTKVYLWQDGAETGNVHYVSGHIIDHDVLVQGIPYGTNDYTEEEDGTSDTGEGIYEIIPAYQIIFDPPPGKVIRNTTISITTDAPGATVYVTTDNSVPSFGVTPAWDSQRRMTISQNCHIRAYAFDSDGLLKAKGAATYTLAWTRPTVSNLNDILADIRKHHEKSLQAYLLKHTEEEEVTIEPLNVTDINGGLDG